MSPVDAMLWSNVPHTLTAAQRANAAALWENIGSSPPLPSLPELFARSKAAAINLGADDVIFRLVLRVFAGNVQCFR